MYGSLWKKTAILEDFDYPFCLSGQGPESGGIMQDEESDATMSVTDDENAPTTPKKSVFAYFSHCKSQFLRPRRNLNGSF